MVRSYPLDMPGVEFSGHGVTGIYEMDERIAFVHFAFGVPSELEIAQKLTPNYVLLDTFSRDFSEHKRSTLTYKQSEIFIASSARCYPENGYFVLNTRYYKGYINSPAKLIKIDNGLMSELGVANEPIKEIYNDAKTYEFDGFCVRMSSPFMMECKEILGGTEFKSEAKDENLNANLPPKEQGARIGKTIWRLKLGAYLYTPVCLNDGGCFTLAPLARAEIYTPWMQKVARWCLSLKPVARSILFGSKVKFCLQTAKISQF